MLFVGVTEGRQERARRRVARKVERTILYAV